MDELKIVSMFTKGLLSKLLRRIIRKNTGYDVDIKLNDISVTVDDGRTHVHLDIDAELEKDELIKIVKSMMKD